MTGTLTNGAAWGTGRNAGAVVVDGVNDYVELGNPTLLQLTGSMTVSAWVNSAAFPGDDAAIVSKRAGAEIGYQLDTTVDRGPRTIGFKLTNSSGGNMFRYGASTLQANTWYHVTGVYNAAASELHVYLNGQLDDGTQLGTVTSTQQNSTANVNIGRRPGFSSFNHNGRIDDVRIYNRALTQTEIQADMNTPVAGHRRHAAPDGTDQPDGDGGELDADQLAWTASTDNVGVTGYRVERCQGAGCSNFVQVGTPAGTVQRHGVGGGDELQLSGAGRRCGRQPERLLERAERDHAAGAGYAGADGADRACRRRRCRRARSIWLGRRRRTTWG